MSPKLAINSSGFIVNFRHEQHANLVLFPANMYLFKFNNIKTKKNKRNMFRVNFIKTPDCGH